MRIITNGDGLEESDHKRAPSARKNDAMPTIPFSTRFGASVKVLRPMPSSAETKRVIHREQSPNTTGTLEAPMESMLGQMPHLMPKIVGSPSMYSTKRTMLPYLSSCPDRVASVCWFSNQRVFGPKYRAWNVLGVFEWSISDCLNSPHQWRLVRK